MTRKTVLVALLTVAFCLAGGRMAFSSEVSDLKSKLEALEQQADQEKDKAKKEDLKKQEKQLKEQIKTAQEQEKAAAKTAEKAKDGKKEMAEKPAPETTAAGKSEAQGLNKFSRFWTQEIGKPMRHFFHGN